MRGVCVVGSFMMDLLVRAPRRPEPGETLVGSSFETFLGGKGFNQAIAAARSGAPTSMVGRLGNDDFGRAFTAALRHAGIDATAVGVDAEIGTGVGMPLVDERGANSIIVIPRANHTVSAADVRGARQMIEASRVLLVQLELPVPAVLEAARIARDAGVAVVLNPAPACDDLAPFAGLVDVIVPNESEAATLTGFGRIVREDNLPAIADRLLETTRAATAIITRGERGAMVIADGKIEMIEAHPTVCVDSVGAGDAFCGAMAASLAEGSPVSVAARYGNAAGAVAVTRPGAEPSMPTREEITHLLHC